MFRFHSLVLIGGLIAIGGVLAAAPRAETRPDPVALVGQCLQEAMRGHLRVGRLLPLMGPEVDAHRQRMAAICQSWLNTDAAASDERLAQCLDEAAQGPRVWRKGRDLDRDHVARLKTLCRRLAKAVTK